MLKQISIDDIDYQGSEPHSAIDRESLELERRDILFNQMGVQVLNDEPLKKVMWYELIEDLYIRTSTGRISKIKKVLFDVVMIELSNLNTGRKFDVRIKNESILKVANTQLELLREGDEVIMSSSEFNGSVIFQKCCKFRKKPEKVGYVKSKIGYIFMKENEIFQIRTKQAKKLNVLNEYAQERKFIE